MRTNDAAHYEYVFRNAISNYKRQSFRPVNDYNLEAVALAVGSEVLVCYQKDTLYKRESKSSI
jgi:hypothetical protein